VGRRCWSARVWRQAVRSHVLPRPTGKHPFPRVAPRTRGFSTLRTPASQPDAWFSVSEARASASPPVGINSWHALLSTRGEAKAEKSPRILPCLLGRFKWLNPFPRRMRCRGQQKIRGQKDDRKCVSPRATSPGGEIPQLFRAWACITESVSPLFPGFSPSKPGSGVSVALV